MRFRGREWLVAPNPNAGWRGVQDPGLPTRHLARIGDCSWQIIDHGHTMGPPGYPATLAHMLLHRGVAMRFSNYFVTMAADVTEANLDRLVPPEADAIILQFGAQHGMRRLLSWTGPPVAHLALWTNWRAGSLGGWAHRRVTAPALDRWGRSYLPEDMSDVQDEHVHRVFSWLADHRPGVPCAMLSSHPVVRSGWVDPVLVEKATERYMKIAHEHGAFVLDYRADLLRWLDAGHLRVHDVFGATGYDLRAAGHYVIAEELLDWLGDLWSDVIGVSAKPSTPTTGHD